LKSIIDKLEYSIRNKKKEIATLEEETILPKQEQKEYEEEKLSLNIEELQQKVI
jgi:hypothetical protein